MRGSPCALDKRTDAYQYLAQPNTAVLECTLYLASTLGDPGISQALNSADQCILGCLYMPSMIEEARC